MSQQPFSDDHLRWPVIPHAQALDDEYIRLMIADDLSPADRIKLNQMIAAKECTAERIGA